MSQVRFHGALRPFVRKYGESLAHTFSHYQERRFVFTPVLGCQASEFSDSNSRCKENLNQRRIPDCEQAGTPGGRLKTTRYGPMSRRKGDCGIQRWRLRAFDYEPQR